MALPITASKARDYLRALRDAGFDRGRLEIQSPDGATVRIIAGAGDDAEPETEADGEDPIMNKINKRGGETS